LDAVAILTEPRVESVTSRGEASVLAVGAQHEHLKRVGFGAGIAGDGSTLVVGNPFAGRAMEGVVYVYDTGDTGDMLSLRCFYQGVEISGSAGSKLAVQRLEVDSTGSSATVYRSAVRRLKESAGLSGDVVGKQQVGRDVSETASALVYVSELLEPGTAFNASLEQQGAYDSVARLTMTTVLAVQPPGFLGSRTGTMAPPCHVVGRFFPSGHSAASYAELLKQRQSEHEASGTNELQDSINSQTNSTATPKLPQNDNRTVAWIPRALQQMAVAYSASRVTVSTNGLLQATDSAPPAGSSRSAPRSSYNSAAFFSAGTTADAGGHLRDASIVARRSQM